MAVNTFSTTLTLTRNYLRCLPLVVMVRALEGHATRVLSNMSSKLIKNKSLAESD